LIGLGKRKRYLAAASLISLLAACSSASPGPDAAPVVAPTVIQTSPSPAVTAAPVTDRFPLTGLPAEKSTEMLRPVMVMVENSPQARPQTGLDQADLVYEILAEGDITRFVAVYHSRSPEAIGPVRSIRPYYVEIGAGLDALIVHAGWSQEAMNMLSSRKLDHFDEVYGDHPYYWRDKEAKAPHNLYTSVEKIRQGASDKKMHGEWKGVKPLFQVREDGDAAAAPGAAPAGSVKVPYIRGYAVEYSYDMGSKLYLRVMDGKPHLDKRTGKQLSAANVLICEAPHKIVDKEGRREVDIHGPGKGVLLQNGVRIDVEWENKQGMIRAYAGGKEVPLTPGQTWVQVVPDLSGVVFGP